MSKHKHIKRITNYAAGNRFARNSIIFTIIIFLIIMIGYLYYHFAPTNIAPPSQVYSQPVDTLTTTTPEQSSTSN